MGVKGHEEVKLRPIHFTVAGATSGVIARVVGQPLDVLKIRFQLQTVQDGKLPYVGIFKSAKTIVKQEGLSALWKGHVPAQILSVLFGAIQFTTYETSHTYINKIFPQCAHSNRLKTGIEFVCGGMAGIGSTLACQPVDVLRTRLVAQKKSTVYRGLFHAITSMFKENGIRTFYKGIVPTLCMIFPNTGLHFAFYGTFKRAWIYFSVNDTENKRLMRLTCGGLSGLCSKLMLLPLDVVKKRLQVQGLTGYAEYNGMVHCFRTVVQLDGIVALYRGASPSVWKATIVSGVTFFTYEQTCDMIRWYEIKKKSFS